MFVLLCEAEYSTLLSTDMNTLKAFHVKCQWQMLNIRWWCHDTNAMVRARSLACR